MRCHCVLWSDLTLRAHDCPNVVSLLKTEVVGGLSVVMEEGSGLGSLLLVVRLLIREEKGPNEHNEEGGLCNISPNFHFNK